MSQFGRTFTSSGPGGFIQTLTSNIGGPVPPTAGNINVIGGNNITGTGNPGTSTITFNLTGTTNHALQVGNATASLTSLAVAGNGQIPIGSAGADPVIANITAGAGIAIANGPGTITISAAGAGMNWQVVVVNQIAANDQGFFTNAAGVVQVALPAVSVVGDTFEVAAMSAGGWQVTQAAGQQIQIGNVATTLGAGGSISSLAIGDWITLVCNVANTNWMARTEQGNFNIV